MTYQHYFAKAIEFRFSLVNDVKSSAVGVFCFDIIKRFSLFVEVKPHKRFVIYSKGAWNNNGIINAFVNIINIILL